MAQPAPAAANDDVEVPDSPPPVVPARRSAFCKQTSDGRCYWYTLQPVGPLGPLPKCMMCEEKMERGDTLMIKMLPRPPPSRSIIGWIHLEKADPADPLAGACAKAFLDAVPLEIGGRKVKTAEELIQLVDERRYALALASQNGAPADFWS